MGHVLPEEKLYEHNFHYKIFKFSKVLIGIGRNDSQQIFKSIGENNNSQNTLDL